VLEDSVAKSIPAKCPRARTATFDHIAFRLSSKVELDAAAAHLDQVGVRHEPVKDIGPSYILEFRDPDNIALELTAPK